MSYQSLADGELAAVVTYLQMHERPADVAVLPSPLRLAHQARITPDDYRALFRTVGAPWLWFSRLIDSDETLAALFAADVALWTVIDEQGDDAGMLELDFRTPGECELSFVGLVPRWAGQGLGRWLLAEAIDRAWRPGINRVHVHTCSLDHPAALSAYRRAGFTAYRRGVERFADPRLAGILPRDCAPQIPLVGTPGATSR